MHRVLLCFASSWLLLNAAVRPVPPPGVPVPEADRKELESGLNRLADSIQKIRASGASAGLLPDVLIFHKAVDYALRYNEFFKADDIFRAKELLRQGQARAAELLQGKPSWPTATGNVVRGYISKIDGSVQPYGLVVPASYSPNLPHRWRVDAWFHGRSEMLSEVNFLFERQRDPGEFTPPHSIVVHLYGRYCNANKLAGEVDLFETLDAMRRQYDIDENRIAVRGFSMGGAAAWHFAAHYSGLWAAAAPGAGFSETPDFLKVFQNESLTPTWWERRLWHMYDATDYAVNLSNVPLVAYSGEIDRQKQAADIMERAMSDEGMRMTHIIGPNTPHRYHPDSKTAINRLIDAAVERGRDPYPKKIRFTTWTLAYNHMKWAVIDALGRHWQRARLDAEILDPRTVEVHTHNVTAFTLDFGAGGSTLDNTAKPVVLVDGQKLSAAAPMSDKSWRVHFHKQGAAWAAGERPKNGLRKRHGLQGPIDDAFLDRFVFVKPTGDAFAGAVGTWTNSELNHAIAEWRRQFRGDAQVKDDTAVTDEDIASSHLVLWGDPSSNKMLARIADKLPLRWTKDTITAGKREFPASSHTAALVYPNPLNPKKYVVLNSGFTFREYDYLNNARQVPKLPDFAIIDTTTAPDDRYPGKIVLAGFFGERWEMLADFGEAPKDAPPLSLSRTETPRRQAPAAPPAETPAPPAPAIP
jgi:dienelactone hydrolase